MKGITQDTVIPMAAKAFAPSKVYVVEFEPVKREAAKELESLNVARDAIDEFLPRIPGIGG